MPGGRLIGITGGIACGKSEVGRILAEAGVDVQDSDAMAHEAIARGGPAYDEVIRRFGRTIVGPDEEIDRAILGERVFADPAERAALNALVHPHVRRAWRTWADEVRASGRMGAVLIPLLFEVGAEKDVDEVWCVAASEDLVVTRLARRGLTEEQTRKRIAAQMPLKEKMRRADVVIENNGSLEELKEETLQKLQTILSKEIKEHG